jgi:hypothetical protein
VPGDPIGGGLADSLAIGFSGGATNYSSLDVVQPLAGADSCFVYRGDTVGAGAIKYQGAYKLVYFAFPFEALSASTTRFRQRTEILERILTWFGGIFPPAGVSSDDATAQLPRPGFGLLHNAPNPFKNQTAISYQLERAARVRLAVYNTLGQQVALLVDGRQQPGTHQATWDGRDARRRPASAGVYFYRLEIDGAGRCGRALLLK